MIGFFIHIVVNGLFLGIVFVAKKISQSRYKLNYRIAFFQLFLANIIDIDHLLANPIYDAVRCSINFHPLHSWYVFPIYLVGLVSKKYRYFFIGIIIHLIVDFFDCFL